MKNVVFPFLIVIAASCTAVRQINNEKIAAGRGCEMLDLSKGYPAINVSLEGTQHAFMFDTGATTSAVNDTTIVPGFTEKEFGSLLGSVKGGDSKKIKHRNFTTVLKNGLFSSENKIVTVTAMPKGKCSSHSNVKGIIGIDCFFNDEQPLFMNFTDGKICNIAPEEMQSRLSVKGYRQIKSQCKANAIYVYVTIGGAEQKMLLDTGYSGQMILPVSSKVNLNAYHPRMVLEGSVFTTISSATSGTEKYYENIPVNFAGQQIMTQPIVSGSLTHQVVGIDFIKGFDWIIDYKNNKVYAKRNHLKIDESNKRKISYAAKASDKLIIAIKEKSQTRYNLGDEIIAVNNQRVTAENNCEWQSFVNRAEDWSTLDLEVIPAAKNND